MVTYSGAQVHLLGEVYCRTNELSLSERRAQRRVESVLDSDLRVVLPVPPALLPPALPWVSADEGLAGHRTPACLPDCLSVLNQELPHPQVKKEAVRFCSSFSPFLLYFNFDSLSLSLHTLGERKRSKALFAFFVFYSSWLCELPLKVASGYLLSETGALRHWMQHGVWWVVQFCL